MEREDEHDDPIFLYSSLALLPMNMLPPSASQSSKDPFGDGRRELDLFIFLPAGLFIAR